MLKVKDLHVYYGNIHAVREISLDVADGELVTIIGGNGAGKSSILKGISGLVKPASGTIEFLGTRIEKLAPHIIVGLGLIQVAEGRQLFSDMTTLENLELGFYGSKETKTIKQKLDEVYGYFPVLRDRRQQKAGTLSGGEQQMLSVARGLMSNPKLLLLDEPSIGLAPIVVENLVRAISSLRKQELTMVLVEQNVSVALEIADRGYVVEAGSIVVSGKSSELRQNGLVKRAYLGI